jgi:hypothetical protein
MTPFDAQDKVYFSIHNAGSVQDVVPKEVRNIIWNRITTISALVRYSVFTQAVYRDLR